MFTRPRRFWAVSLAHMTNDIFMSMGGVVLAFAATAVLPLSNAQIGFAISLTQISGALSQPFFGLLADRTGGRVLGTGGVAWVVTMLLTALTLASVTGSYVLMLIPFALMGLGSGAFHPVGSLHAAESDKARVASSMSIFFLFGQLGLGIGPALAGALLDSAATHNNAAFLLSSTFDGLLRERGTVFPVFILAALAVPALSFMLLALPNHAHHRAGTQAKKSAEDAVRKPLHVGALATLALMIALRALAQPGSAAFMPVLFQAKGWSPAQYGLITSSFWLASGLVGVLFGALADRFDRRWVIAISMVAAAPAFFLLPPADGALAFLLAILAGGLSGGSHSLIVVMAQEFIPAAKGFASGLALGSIFGAGALGTLLIGAMADAFGVGGAFQVVALALVLAAGIALLLPKRSLPLRVIPVPEAPLASVTEAGD